MRAALMLVGLASGDPLCTTAPHASLARSHQARRMATQAMPRPRLVRGPAKYQKAKWAFGGLQQCLIALGVTVYTLSTRGLAVISLLTLTPCAGHWGSSHCMGDGEDT